MADKRFKSELSLAAQTAMAREAHGLSCLPRCEGDNCALECARPSSDDHRTVMGLNPANSPHNLGTRCLR